MWVKLRHNDGTVTLYGHIDTTTVTVGDRVTAGDQIATMGNRGNSTGPHLHFEFRVNGVHRDPLTVARQNESIPVSAAARPAFNRLAAATRSQLMAAATVQQASAQ